MVGLGDVDLHFPVLGFPEHGDVMPFESFELLAGKTGWLAQQGRHLGLRIVDSDEQCWVVSGIVQREPIKKPWWKLGRSADHGRPFPEADLRLVEPQPFAVTKARVEEQAALLFDEDDEARIQIGAAGNLADLSHACLQITFRAQVRRILAGEPDVPIRTVAEVARRALVLFAMVRLSHDVGRFNLMDWLDKHDLIGALSPQEAELLSMRRLTAEQASEAGWSIEGLIALLWALGFVDMPSSHEFAEMAVVMDIVPPSAEMTVDAFLAKSALRPAMEIAAMAEHRHKEPRPMAEEDGEAIVADDDAAAQLAHLRRGALQWLLNPDRVNWF